MSENIQKVKILNFAEVFEDVTRLCEKIHASDYLKSGMHQIIDQGQNDIAGYTNKNVGFYTDTPAIIFGDHTRVIKYVDKPFFIGADGVKVLKPKIEGLNAKYLYYVLLNAKIPNTGYNRHFKWLKEIRIPVMPINIQERIVSTLNVVENIIGKRKKQLEKLDELIKSRFIEMFGAIPQESFVLLSELCKIITDGTHQPPKFCDKGIPFLFVSNIANNEIDYDTEKYISRETYLDLIRRTPIEFGDILLSTVGSYGHPAIVTGNREFCFQRHIAYLKPKSDLIESCYLYGALLSPIGQEQIARAVKGIAQKTLNLSEVRNIKIPLVSLECQKLYSAFCQQTDKSKFIIKQSLNQLKVLKKSLMQKYFG